MSWRHVMKAGGEDYVHTQMREYWLATGQITEAQGGHAVGPDEFRNLTFLASWGYVPEDPTPAVSDAGWAGAWAPVAWSAQWMDLSTSGSTYTAAWSAGWA